MLVADVSLQFGWDHPSNHRADELDHGQEDVLSIRFHRRVFDVRVARRNLLQGRNGLPDFKERFATHGPVDDSLL